MNNIKFKKEREKSTSFMKDCLVKENFYVGSKIVQVRDRESDYSLSLLTSITKSFFFSFFPVHTTLSLIFTCLHLSAYATKCGARFESLYRNNLAHDKDKVILFYLF